MVESFYLRKSAIISKANEYFDLGLVSWPVDEAYLYPGLRTRWRVAGWRLVLGRPRLRHVDSHLTVWSIVTSGHHHHHLVRIIRLLGVERPLHWFGVLRADYHYTAAAASSGPATRTTNEYD